MVEDNNCRICIEADIEELLSCCHCIHRRTDNNEQEFCSLYRQEIPEGIDWGNECLHFKEVNQSGGNMSLNKYPVFFSYYGCDIWMSYSDTENIEDAFLLTSTETKESAIQACQTLNGMIERIVYEAEEKPSSFFIEYLDTKLDDLCEGEIDVISLQCKDDVLTVHSVIETESFPIESRDFIRVKNNINHDLRQH